MKKFLSIFCFIIVSSISLMASNGPDLIKADGIEVIALGEKQIITTAHFDNTTKDIVFTTAAAVVAIQIFNENEELALQLPIMSEEVSINKSLLGSAGEYKIGFIVGNDSEVYYATVNICP